MGSGSSLSSLEDDERPPRDKEGNKKKPPKPPTGKDKPPPPKKDTKPTAPKPLPAKGKPAPQKKDAKPAKSKPPIPKKKEPNKSSKPSPQEAKTKPPEDKLQNKDADKELKKAESLPSEVNLTPVKNESNEDAQKSFSPSSADEFPPDTVIEDTEPAVIPSKKVSNKDSLAVSLPSSVGNISSSTLTEDKKVTSPLLKKKYKTNTSPQDEPLEVVIRITSRHSRSTFHSPPLYQGFESTASKTSSDELELPLDKSHSLLHKIVSSSISAQSKSKFSQPNLGLTEERELATLITPLDEAHPPPISDTVLENKESDLKANQWSENTQDAATSTSSSSHEKSTPSQFDRSLGTQTSVATSTIPHDEVQSAQLNEESIKNKLTPCILALLERFFSLVGNKGPCEIKEKATSTSSLEKFQQFKEESTKNKLTTHIVALLERFFSLVGNKGPCEIKNMATSTSSLDKFQSSQTNPRPVESIDIATSMSSFDKVQAINTNGDCSKERLMKTIIALLDEYTSQCCDGLTKYRDIATSTSFLPTSDFDSGNSTQVVTETTPRNNIQSTQKNKETETRASSLEKSSSSIPSQFEGSLGTQTSVATSTIPHDKVQSAQLNEESTNNRLTTYIIALLERFFSFVGNKGPCEIKNMATSTSSLEKFQSSQTNPRPVESMDIATSMSSLDKVQAINTNGDCSKERLMTIISLLDEYTSQCCDMLAKYRDIATSTSFLQPSDFDSSNSTEVVTETTPRNNIQSTQKNKENETRAYVFLLQPPQFNTNHVQNRKVATSTSPLQLSNFNFKTPFESLGKEELKEFYAFNHLSKPSEVFMKDQDELTIPTKQEPSNASEILTKNQGELPVSVTSDPPSPHNKQPSTAHYGVYEAKPLSQFASPPNKQSSFVSHGVQLAKSVSQTASVAVQTSSHVFASNSSDPSNHRASVCGGEPDSFLLDLPPSHQNVAQTMIVHDYIPCSPPQWSRGSIICECLPVGYSYSPRRPEKVHVFVRNKQPMERYHWPCGMLSCTDCCNTFYDSDEKCLPRQCRIMKYKPASSDAKILTIQSSKK